MEKMRMEGLNRLSPEEFKTRSKLPLTLVLDNVRSGLNVGSIFRTADAFAVRQLLLCGITAQPPHREILKTALGSTESVEWKHFDTTAAAIRHLLSEGCRVYALEQAQPKTWLQEFAPQAGSQYALLLGNEVDGIGEEALALCEGALEIPQFGTKHSLNVAVAAGIATWEIARKILLPAQF